MWHWFALIGFIVALVVIDLLLVHRTAHVITIREATMRRRLVVTYRDNAYLSPAATRLVELFSSSEAGM